MKAELAIEAGPKLFVNNAIACGGGAGISCRAVNSFKHSCMFVFISEDSWGREGTDPGAKIRNQGRDLGHFEASFIQTMRYSYCRPTYN